MELERELARLREQVDQAAHRLELDTIYFLKGKEA